MITFAHSFSFSTPSLSQMRAVAVFTAIASSTAAWVWWTSDGERDWGPKVPMAAFPVVYAAIFSVMLSEIRNDFSEELVRAPVLNRYHAVRTVPLTAAVLYVCAGDAEAVEIPPEEAVADAVVLVS
jgi:hypothetical protein